jgi:hypothetical protein
MIFDRTKKDVENAKILRRNKVQQFKALTDDEILILEKGTITINTLNRIESKQAQLKELFNDMGYWNIEIFNKQWDDAQIFDEKEFQRVLNNTNALKQAFLIYSNTPTTPNVSYHYDDINALEKILHDLDVMVEDIKSNYRQCGNFESGGY